MISCKEHVENLSEVERHKIIAELFQSVLGVVK
jgi:hypothetical protein